MSKRDSTHHQRPKRTLLSWSSGKDSAWTLYRLQQDPTIELAGLVTTVNMTHGRVAMHAVREVILAAQAKAAGLPLIKVPIPSPCTNAEYEAAMAKCIDNAVADGVTHFAFGDLFLEDIRQYREDKLAGTGITPLFPLWGEATDKLAAEMIAGGLEAYLTCVDPKQLDPSFAGRAFGAALLKDLPDGVDACGENGEFHTCVLAGPMFDGVIAAELGEIVERDGFVFADVVMV